MRRLRPHHILDIIRNIGNNRETAPHEYGHLVHVITAEILENIDRECRLIIANDDICGPCRMLNSQQQCTDILHQLEVPVSKQEYNDNLDRRILDHLRIEPDSVMNLKDYLKLIAADMDNIVRICTHPKEDPEYRRNGLVRGLNKLNIPYPPESKSSE